MQSAPPTESARGVQAAVVAYVVWGLLTLYWKELVSFRPFELVAWRMVSSAVVMVALVAVVSGLAPFWRRVRQGSTRWKVLLAGALLTVNWTSYVWAVVNDRVLEGALGYFMAPLGTIVLGVTVLRERPTTLQRVALVCAIVAVTVLTVSYGRVPWAALAISVSWSTYGLVKRSTDLTSLEGLTAETLAMTPLALAVVTVDWADAASIPSTAAGGDWALIAGTGVVTAVPLVLFGFAAMRVRFTILGVLQYIVPMINFALGWLVYDEALPPSRIAGFALIWVALAAITFEQIDHRRRARLSETSNDRSSPSRPPAPRRGRDSRRPARRVLQ